MMPAGAKRELLRATFDSVVTASTGDLSLCLRPNHGWVVGAHDAAAQDDDP